MKRRGFTLDEHRAIGARLHAMRNELTEIVTTILNAYPRGSAPARTAARAVDPIDRLRSALDDAGFIEHPQFDPGVYYPGAKGGV